MKCFKCETVNTADSKFCKACAAPLPGAEAQASLNETFQMPVRELSTGSTFAGRYQVIEELGHGGMETGPAGVKIIINAQAFFHGLPGSSPSTSFSS